MARTIKWAGANDTAGETDIISRSPAPSGIAIKVNIPIRHVRAFIAFLAVPAAALPAGRISAVQAVDHIETEKNRRRLRYAEGSVRPKRAFRCGPTDWRAPRWEANSPILVIRRRRF